MKRLVPHFLAAALLIALLVAPTVAAHNCEAFAGNCPRQHDHYGRKVCRRPRVHATGGGPRREQGY